MKMTGAFPKTMFLDELIHHTKLELLEECDYVSEALKQTRMHDLLKDDKRFNVPLII